MSSCAPARGLLLQQATFRIAEGEKVGLVGRNGAGKTTLTKVLSGAGEPAGGSVVRSGTIGYLPQDPRTGDLDQQALSRILSVRGLDDIIEQLRAAERGMGTTHDDDRDRAMRRYSRLDAEFAAAGGYAAESTASRIASSLGLTERVAAPAARNAVRGSATPRRAHAHPVQRRQTRCCSTNRPTTWTPTPSSGCASFCGPTPAASWSSPTMSSCSRRQSPGCFIWTPTVLSSMSTTWGGVPTSRKERPTSVVGVANAPTPSGRRRPCATKRSECVPRRPRRGLRRTCCVGRTD